MFSWPIRYCMEKSEPDTNTPNYCNPAAHTRRGLNIIDVSGQSEGALPSSSVLLTLQLHLPAAGSLVALTKCEAANISVHVVSQVRVWPVF